MSQEKFDELDSWVGNNEPNYCGRCKDKTQHIVTREADYSQNY